MTVGETTIGTKDISYEIGIESAYGNDTITPAGALVSLVNDVLERQVARVARALPSSEDMAALAEHADESSRAPETLASVKAVFGRDVASYERLYLAPKIINRKLRARYARYAETHGQQRSAIEEARCFVRSGKSLKEAAAKCRLRHLTFEYGDDEDASGEPRTYFPEAGGQKEPLAEIIETLSPGQVYENIIEDERSYRIIRLVERDGPRRKVEVVQAEKRPFEEWFRKHAEEIEVRILDPELREAVRSVYPNVWWVKQWLGN